MLIAAAAPRAGEHVVHVGAGVGYYTAILAHMVGGSGRVTAIEFDGGRLILPLTSNNSSGENPENIPIQRRGAVFRIERRGDEFLAKWISAVAIFPCEGARDTACERALAAAFEKGGWERVTRLYRRGDLPDEQC